MVSKKHILHTITDNLRTWKYNIVRPILPIFKFFGITPNALSTSKLFLLIPFYYFLLSEPIISGILILVMILMDAFDGPLASYTHVNSDRGAFVDIFTDTLSVAIIIFILAYLGLISFVTTSLFILLWSTVHILAVIYYNEKRKSEWIIQPVANIGYYKIIIILAIWAYTFASINWMNEILVVTNFYMIFQSIYYYFAILRRWSLQK